VVPGYQAIECPLTSFLVALRHAQYTRPGVHIALPDDRIDECDVKPGAPEENPYCVVRYVASYDARISFHASGADDSERGVSLVWRPRGPVTAKVTGTCLPDFIARRQREVTERGYGISSAHTFEFAAQIAPNGIPRAGRHEEPIGDNIGHEIWTIGTGPEDDVRITITGPSCACLEGEVAAPKVTDFTARASTGGGAFGQWVVTPEGDAPRQLVNNGGATGTLSLGVTRTTTRFTVAIAYTRDGRTYQSGPRRASASSGAGKCVPSRARCRRERSVAEVKGSGA